MTDKPYSQACENNKQPILDKIQPLLKSCSSVLEIGSGTGQHAVFFAGQMPHLRWQCCDQRPYLDGIEAWRQDSGLNTLPPAVEFEVMSSPWPAGRFDAVYSANTLHIMGWPQVEALFRRLGESTSPGTLLMVYGPFNIGGQFTSPSNAEFDQMLRQRDPASGIRGLEAVNAEALAAGFVHQHDYALPANNRLQVWRKQ